MDAASYRYGELFCGPGGMALGAIRARATLDGTKHRIVHTWATDFDEDSCETYRNNICPEDRDSVICEDVRELDISSLEPIDILAFGFPCNDFSIVGETKGMDGDFGMLYQYGVKALDEHRPKAFVAENVSGIRGANQGKAWVKITEDLERAGDGYDIYAHHYHFENYGVPQMRHRYILVGISKELGVKFLHPEPTTIDNPRTCYQALHEPPIPPGVTHHISRPLKPEVQNRLSYIKEGDNAWSEDIPPELRLNVQGARLSNIYRRMDRSLPAFTITGSGGGGTHGYHWSDDRALTNREKARIQTFPDDYEFEGGVTSVRKQIGMAVPPDGVRIIFDHLLQALASSEKIELVERVDLTRSIGDKSGINLNKAKGRVNSKTGIEKERPWYEMELQVGTEYPNLPKRFEVYTSKGRFSMNRTSGPSGTPREEQIYKLAGQGRDRSEFGIWLKERIYNNTTLQKPQRISEDALEEFGTTTLDFYKIKDGLFLARLDPKP